MQLSKSGFRQNQSTEVYLSFLNDKSPKSFDQGSATDMILTDLQKAFDTIDHDENCMLLASPDIR